MGESAAVADATVLIFLGKLRRLQWLRLRYDSILIPQQVYAEVVEAGREIGAADAAVVADAIDDGWIVPRQVHPSANLETFDLEAGETAVLSLAVDEGHEDVLVDEESVREVARLLGLNPRGTLSFLFTTLREGEITFGEFLESLERLLESGMYLHESIYVEAVRKAREIADADG